MRNDNPDIIIHSLVEKSANKSEFSNSKYDYFEEKKLEEQRRERLHHLRKDQEKKEMDGVWITVEYKDKKYTILIEKGADIQKKAEEFVNKLKRRQNFVV